MNKKISKNIILVVFLIIGIAVRSYKINSPIADWHSWRQADTAAVARNFIKSGINLLYPKFDDLSSIPSGIDNPEGYRFVEFPIYNLAHALSFKVNAAIDGPLNFEAAGRLVNLLLWVWAGYFLYQIVRKKTNWTTAIFSLFFFLFLPYNIFYSRTILPDPSMVFFTIASIYFLLSWQKKQKPAISFSLSLIFSVAAVLTKPYAIFILVPSWAVVFYQTKNYFKGIIFAIFSAVPFLLWRHWMKQFPEAIPANDWLFNAGGMRLKPAWWRWLFYERLAKLVLGGWGAAILAVGAATKINKKNIIFWSWLAGGLAYLVVFARGNIQHDYYQIILAPIVSVFLAMGINLIISLPKTTTNRLSCWLAVLTISLSTILFSGYQIKDYYQINHPEIVDAGIKADQILPKNAKVIAPYGGDTAFLYQTKRQGWPIAIYSLNDALKLGADYYISVNFDEETKKIAEQCTVLEKTDQWIIVDLSLCTD
jgi:hypothetical protein